MAGFGGMPYGSGPYGSGTEFELQFVTCIVRASNEIWLVVEGFSDLPDYDANSEINPKNWTITPLEVDGFNRLVQSVERVETRDDAIRAGAVNLWDFGFQPALRVFTDGPLSPGEEYLLRYSGLGVETCQITALFVEEVALARTPAQDNGTIEDFKNPQLSRDKLPLGKLGTFNLTDDGDIGIDNGLSSLRKRILRRIQTSVSAFYHLPTYGTELNLKSSITPDLARRISQRVNNGVRNEPDVLNSKTNVYAVQDEEGMIVVSVTATSRFGETITVSEQVSING